MEKRYIMYMSSKTQISYDDSGWYINEKQQQNTENGGKSSEQEAQTKASQMMADDLAKLLTHFSNVAVLTAAGTSMDNGKNSGKTRSGLWEECTKTIEAIKKYLESKKQFNEKIAKEYEDKNIERFLSYLLMYENFNGRIVGDDNESLVANLEKAIFQNCTLQLDENNQHHGDFIAKLTARKPSDPRFQLFTTNYDTLFEQAAHKRGYTIIDGFSFSYPREFNGLYFDYDIVYRNRTRIKNEESFAPKVFHLYKLHGSVDWDLRENGKVYQSENVKTPCIVYPANNKYESSYEQPYFEMMAHFQQTLRRDGTLLIVVGFGFADKHIQNVIKEAVLQNSNFHLLIVCYGTNDGKQTGITQQLAPDFINEEMNVPTNVTIYFSTFKEFVKVIPTNHSYSDDINNETIRP